MASSLIANQSTKEHAWMSGREWVRLALAGAAVTLSSPFGLWSALQRNADRTEFALPESLAFQLASTTAQIALMMVIGLYFAHCSDMDTVTRGLFWTGIGIVAIFLGLGQLPAASPTITHTPLIILQAIVLNGILRVFSGAVYWKRGLEAAMLTQFSSEIVFHFTFTFLA